MGSKPVPPGACELTPVDPAGNPPRIKPKGRDKFPLMLLSEEEGGEDGIHRIHGPVLDRDTPLRL